MSGKQSSGSKPVSLVQKISKIDPRRISSKCSPFSKKIVLGKNPKLANGSKISSFQHKLGKLTQDQEILYLVKGYMIPFLKVPVQRTIPKQVTTSKTQELLTDQEIIEVLDKGAIKKVEH